MRDGPFYRVRRTGYEICFAPGAGEDLDEVCDVDMWVVRDPGVPSMVEVIDGLVATGEYETVLRNVGPEGDV
ncbi:hypothetical protein SAMN05216489_07911 [Streptomyces sp. 3213]|uniref:hypothetical protein n=1 Tax=Streptomyces sp. 3213.3 TaxID=1855348 RepID=UPI0008943051|nr:hypothetical protein [Streptomyces sp. 3213.3]SEE70695.1 hypothetical protein SAMN05216489_07911 [Streptomyces sp. 3213] [Streptomyces sp. 3213.3]